MRGQRGGGWWGVVLALLVAGGMNGAELPSAPEGHVLDAAGLFDRSPERLEAVSQRLVGLNSEHALPVYLVIYGGLIDGRIDRRARRLHDSWIGPERDGLVVVWDSDTGDLEVGLPRATYHDAATGPGGRTRLPDPRVRPVLDAVRAEVAGITDKRAYVERLSVALAERLDRMLRQEEDQGGSSAGSVALGTLVLGGVLALLGAGAGRFMRRVEETPRRQCYFPDVLVGARLGASWGGGRVAVVDYSRDEPEELE